MDIRRFFSSIESEDLTNEANENEIEDVRTDSIIGDNQNFAERQGEIGIEYEIIPGKKINSKYVYLINEKLIFKPINADTKNGRRYVCITASCPAKIVIRPNGICAISKRSKPDNIHPNHTQKRDEFIATDKIKEKCSNVDELCGGSGSNVSVKSIFDNEIIR